MRPLYIQILFVACLGTLSAGASGNYAGSNAVLPSPYISQDSSFQKLLGEFELKLRAGAPLPELEQVLAALALNGSCKGDTRSIECSDYYYLLGYFFQIRVMDADSAIKYYDRAVSIRKELGRQDQRYATACYNMGSIYQVRQEYRMSIEYLNEALRVREKLFGASSPQLLAIYLNLSVSYMDSFQYDEGLQAALKGIETFNRGGGEPRYYISLQINAGVICQRYADYSRAESHFKAALNKYGNSDVTTDHRLNELILSALAVSYRFLGDFPAADLYYNSAIDLLERGKYETPNGSVPYSNYAYFLASIDSIGKAEEYMRRALDYSSRNYGSDDRRYFDNLEDLAFFLAYYREDYQAAGEMFDICLDYARSNLYDNKFRNKVDIDYSYYLTMSGQYERSMKWIDSLLVRKELLLPREQIKVYNNRSQVLQSLFMQDNDPDLLVGALESAEEAISLVEDQRLAIKAEESRLTVTDRYENVYNNCIGIISSLYGVTGDSDYIDRAFQYSERSKAATLLASTRSASAIRYHIPEELAHLESSIKGEIDVLKDQIYNERSGQSPDQGLIAIYDEKLLRLTTRDDSLKRFFEKEFPDYYNLTHSKDVSDLNSIRRSLGKGENFIEYYFSDTTLYIFLANRKGIFMVSKQFDSNFRDAIIDFRTILLHPAINRGAIEQFSSYCRSAKWIYDLLLGPVADNLVPGKLIIVPDDLLNYIPFESLIARLPGEGITNFRDLEYMFKEFDIKYAYSGTLLSESVGSRPSLRNRSIAFAPDYSGEIYSDSLLLSRQLERGDLRNIPGAREEAIFVNSILGGTVYLDTMATEGRFKSESGNYSVIHLSMHTLLNDKNPMFSKLVFSFSDRYEDGTLNTYEVYNQKLNAKMVFLSSCNTGSGFLQSGEGVMSLARGFIYSGSPSVVMSLWEVDDRSGSEIVSSFYRNLAKGWTKSRSLRKAREDFLANADQLQSHPYFWSTLVILGNDDALFIPIARWSFVLLLLVILTVVARKWYRR